MYKLHNDILTNQPSSIIRTTDGASIPMNSANTDYQQYLKFLEEGGQPIPADEGTQ